jgi:hypothetical protein
VATESQIQANRRNAQKSTGPKSTAGQKRASQNALRHGLTKPLPGPLYERKIETLAHKIAGDNATTTKLALARTAAEAEFELQRVRLLEIAMHERIMLSGSGDRLTPDRSAKEEFRSMVNNIARLADRGSLRLPWPDATRPMKESDKTEAIRRLLPELGRLLRYEKRAAGRRNKALREISKL